MNRIANPDGHKLTTDEQEALKTGERYWMKHEWPEGAGWSLNEVVVPYQRHIPGTQDEVGSVRGILTLPGDGDGYTYPFAFTPYDEDRVEGAISPPTLSS